jgi:T5orf172 domain
MPIGPFTKREAKRPIWETAAFVQFQDFTPEEEFCTCVHLTSGPRPRRCTMPINKKDRQTARGFYLQIRSLLADGTSVQDLLSELAKVTLCNHVHRPRDGTETLYTRMVQNWSNNFEIDEGTIRQPKLEDDVPEAVLIPVERPPDGAVHSIGYSETQVRSKGAGDADSSPSELRDLDMLAVGALDLQMGSLSDKPEIMVKEEEIYRSAQASPLPKPSRPDSKPPSKPTSLPRPLRDFVTRCGTFPPVQEEYLPYCPDLLTFTHLQLIHYTNHSLLSYLSKRLGKMAKRDGYVYIFIRPDDPKLVKIGYTEKSPEGRVATWGKGCCYAARRMFDTGKIPHAWLVERLVQIQLKQYRKREQRCKWKAMCPTKHTEWYEVGVQEARQTIELWADWVTQSRPWGSDGYLTSEWMSLLNKYRLALKGPDRDEKMWERWVRMEDPREAVSVVQNPTPTSTSMPKSKTAAAATTTPPTTEQDLGQLPSRTCLQNRQTPKPSSQLPPSSTTMQTSNPRTTQTPSLAKKYTTPKSTKPDDSPPSPSPASKQTFSSTPTTTDSLKQSVRHNNYTFQTPPDQTRRAILESALLSSLDDYMAASPGRRRNSPRLASRLDRKFVDWACGELDEGYCTA